MYTHGLPSRRSTWGLGCGLLVAIVLAGCSQSTGSGRASSPTTAPGISHVVTPSIRTGQIYVPPGRSATKGPIGPNPSLAHGLQLNIIAGLGHDQPIYDGDFADPSALAV